MKEHVSEIDAISNYCVYFPFRIKMCQQLPKSSLTTIVRLRVNLLVLSPPHCSENDIFFAIKNIFGHSNRDSAQIKVNLFFSPALEQILMLPLGYTVITTINSSLRLFDNCELIRRKNVLREG